MWDSGFMAEINNFSEINENFDTVKTLLNSIRAQGILNTSDVDKLLSGINAKLEKINTEEDIDIIKVFLTELKQTLDERHNVLVSKFGAIESLFSNLLKNSNELPKSTELKELFDVVATNLSVFSREVVSQKETLTDITLRLDAIRSDDSQKKDIIKNITLLKPDLERLNNGFDSIVLSLNDNFKTIVKTITSIDKTEYLENFSGALNNIEMSSNALLSAIQVLDRKTEGVDDAIQNLVTKKDLTETGRSIEELKVLNMSLNDTVGEINQHYSRIDNLADKIDASVNIIAGLKSVLEDTDDKNTKTLLTKLEELESEVNKITTDTKFEDFKVSMASVLKDISDTTVILDKNLSSGSEEIAKVIEMLKNLDTKTGFEELLASANSSKSEIKDYVDENTQKVMSLEEANTAKILSDISSNKNVLGESTQKIISSGEANVTRVLNDITSNAEALNSKIGLAQSEISSLCNSNFGSVFENIEELKKVVSQIDDNGVSSYNAMFSNITDRLNMFESMLKDSLETQENSASTASAQLYEQIDNIKNLSNVLDYKMDSSVVEVSNMTRGFETLKSSIDEVLALDFVNTVKDLRADLYASKQEMSLSFENSGNELSEKLSSDLYGKYELLISKLDTVEDDFIKAQTSSLTDIKEVTDKISSALVDILSYVSVEKSQNNEALEKKIDGITDSVKDTALNYVENVRDVVDIIRVQVENNLKNIEEEHSRSFASVEKTIEKSSDAIKSDIKNSYDKLLEIQTAYNEIKEILNINNIDNSDKFEQLSDSAKNINAEFESKIGSLKNELLDKITEFKQAFTCENADKINEFKFAVENIYNKNSQEIAESLENIKTGMSESSSENALSRSLAVDTIVNNINNLKELCTAISNDEKNSRETALNNILDSFSNLSGQLNTLSSEIYEGRSAGLNNVFERIESVKSLLTSIESKSSDKRDSALTEIIDEFEKLRSQTEELKIEMSEERTSALGRIFDNFDSVRDLIDKFVYENSNSRTSALAKILENLVGLKEYVTSLSDKSEEVLNAKVQDLSDVIETLKATMDRVDENVDGDMTRQLSIIESNFESLVSQITILFEKTDKTLSDRVNEEMADISDRLMNSVEQKLETYKTKIEETFDRLGDKAESQSSYLQERIADINDTLKSVWESQSASNIQQIQDVSVRLKSVLEEHIGLAQVDYASLKDKISDFASNLETHNENLVQNLKAQLDDMAKYIDSVLDIQVQEAGAKYSDLAGLLKDSTEALSEKSDNINAITSEQLESSKAARAELSDLSALVASTNALLATVEREFTEKTDNLSAITAESASTGVKTIEESANKILEQIELGKVAINAGKDLITQVLDRELKVISSNIEKETDTIFAELTEQFEILKKSQKDETIKITSGIDAIVTDQIAANIEDLKSYLDIKTDNSILSEKLDSLKLELSATFDETIKTLNKTLNTDVFTSSISDFKAANEIIMSSSIDKLNDNLERFIADNLKDIAGALDSSSKSVEDKLALFDKKFIDTVVDKYEEIKLLSNGYNSSLEKVSEYLNNLFTDFAGVKTSISDKINSLSAEIKKSTEVSSAEIRQLRESFDNLRTQISSKSFDEAFQASINKQIASLEGLIQDQFGYLEDINELCTINLPDVAELNAVVKNSVVKSINEFSNKLDLMDVEGTISSNLQNVSSLIDKELKTIKTDVITQMLNIFNQISFVTEQDEILDFIQEKHDELITVLSHIVTTNEDIATVKNNLVTVDNNISSVRNEIDSINEKINSIISSDGDIDYIYSLQDLEADIANLRLVLQSIKDDNNHSELAELAASTENIYKLLEAVKAELPDKHALDGLAEDIVSISTRTNKLILASDESYKTLQEHLHDFKLVINDLDERTKNFSHESGMDRIDSKLNALNTMVQNGSKMNQVFNQVFEYLAEWVDNAGNKINAISDKVDTLDEIGQIKVMLADLKDESQDNSESIELIEALGNVFDKQAKKISSLETKLDKMIVQTTISNKNSKIDLTPMEDTLNHFLVAIGDKISYQQSKIDSLESKLEKVIGVLNEKDTAQLTKKVGGMDRQIAKLNKSIEKIASHVVEK